MSDGRLRVWASGRLGPASGIGVVQRHLYPRLAALGVDVTVGRDRRSRPRSRRPSEWGPYWIAKATELVEVVPPGFDAALVCARPIPARVDTPLVYLFHSAYALDRGNVARRYRHWDLRRSLRRAHAVLAVSAHAADQVVTLAPECRDKVEVARLGPGHLTPSGFTRGEPGLVLLAGGARHKRNELAVRALHAAGPPWCRRIAGLGVSPGTRRAAEAAFGPTNCEWFEGISEDEVARLYARADVYVSLSTEEGFGLPSVEALCAGCQVVAIRQAITEELLGPAGVLIEDGDADAIAKQFTGISSWPSDDVRLERTRRFSWDRMAEIVAGALHRAAASRSS